MIVFLVWLWISNIAVLLGAVMNAEIDRGSTAALERASTHQL